MGSAVTVEKSPNIFNVYLHLINIYKKNTIPTHIKLYIFQK